MKPPIAYFGSKTATAERIASLMPEHAGYIEPFAGSLAVLLAKPPARLEVANDLDRRLVTFWRVLRDRSDDLLRAAALTPHSRTELDTALNGLDTDDELELARRVWVCLTQGRSRTLKPTGWRFFSDPVNAAFADYMTNYRDRLEASAQRLARVTLECRPAIEVIDQYGAAPSNLLYVDPPYLGAVRQGWDRYPHDMREEEPHRELAEHLHACQSAVVLSGYASDLYDRDLFDDWDRREIASFTGEGATRARVEVVWANRSLDNYLFNLDEDAS